MHHSTLVQMIQQQLLKTLEMRHHMSVQAQRSLRLARSGRATRSRRSMKLLQQQESLFLPRHTLGLARRKTCPTPTSPWSCHQWVWSQSLSRWTPQRESSLDRSHQLEKIQVQGNNDS